MTDKEIIAHCRKTIDAATERYRNAATKTERDEAFEAICRAEFFETRAKIRLRR